MNILRRRWALPENKPRVEVSQIGLSDYSEAKITRGRFVEERFKIGPNMVSAVIFHPDGSYEDLGLSPNLITNGGKDYVAKCLGGKAGFGIISTVATASSATSLTATGTPFVADAYKGFICIAENGTDSPVFGNIGTNSTSVLTIDAWRYGDESAGATPLATANYGILPGVGIAKYMALTENAAAAAAADAVLTGEITTGGCNRQVATFAHTDGANTYTLQKAYSVTASFPAIHKMGLFTASTLAATGVLVFETVLNADANVVNGDTLTVTDTVTLT